MVDGEGRGNSAGCLKWGSSGPLRNRSKTHRKIGGGQKQKLFVGGGGKEGVPTRALLPKSFYRTPLLPAEKLQWGCR